MLFFLRYVFYYVPSSRRLLTHVQIVRRYDENKSDKKLLRNGSEVEDR